jgi:hypothetical protein
MASILMDDMDDRGDVAELEAIPEVGAPNRGGRPLGSKDKAPRRSKRRSSRSRSRRAAAPASSGPAEPDGAPSIGVDMGTLPPEVVAGFALAPLMAARGFVKVRTGGLVDLHYTPEACAMVVQSFTAWLDSMEVELSPGWALLASYAMAFGGAAMRAQSEIQKHAAAAPAPAPEAPNHATDHAAAVSGQPTGPAAASA